MSSQSPQRRKSEVEGDGVIGNQAETAAVFREQGQSPRERDFRWRVLVGLPEQPDRPAAPGSPGAIEMHQQFGSPRSHQSGDADHFTRSDLNVIAGVARSGDGGGDLERRDLQQGGPNPRAEEAASARPRTPAARPSRGSDLAAVRRRSERRRFRPSRSTVIRSAMARTSSSRCVMYEAATPGERAGGPSSKSRDSASPSAAVGSSRISSRDSPADGLEDLDLLLPADAERAWAGPPGRRSRRIARAVPSPHESAGASRSAGPSEVSRPGRGSPPPTAFARSPAPDRSRRFPPGWHRAARGTAPHGRRPRSCHVAAMGIYPGHDLDQRRLACAVLTAKTMNLAGANLEVDSVECLHASESLDNLVDPEHGAGCRAGHRFRSSAR